MRKKSPRSRQDAYLRAPLVLPQMARRKVLNFDLPDDLTNKLHEYMACCVKLNSVLRLLFTVARNDC